MAHFSWRRYFGRACISSLLFLSIFSHSENAPDRTVFTMAYTADPAQSLTMAWYHKLISEAFGRLGITLEYAVYPPLRATTLLKTGNIDVEGLRAANYEDDNPDAVIVRESILTTKYGMATINPEIQLDRLSDLEGKSYRVEYLRGVEPLGDKLNDVVSEGYLFAITSPGQGLHKLLAGRSDVFIDFPGRLSALIESLDLSLAGIHVNEFEDDIIVYPVLHRRHANLAQPLQEVLSEMKAQGLFEQYMEETRKVFLLPHDQ
jgi:hypothetical protein